jgi:tetratricopeptide (TPR) repeat protein
VALGQLARHLRARRRPRLDEDRLRDDPRRPALTEAIALHRLLITVYFIIDARKLPVPVLSALNLSQALGRSPERVEAESMFCFIVACFVSPGWMVRDSERVLADAEALGFPGHLAIARLARVVVTDALGHFGESGPMARRAYEELRRRRDFDLLGVAFMVWARQTLTREGRARLVAEEARDLLDVLERWRFTQTAAPVRSTLGVAEAMSGRLDAASQAFAAIATRPGSLDGPVLLAERIEALVWARAFEEALALADGARGLTPLLPLTHVAGFARSCTLARFERLFEARARRTLTPRERREARRMAAACARKSTACPPYHQAAQVWVGVADWLDGRRDAARAAFARALDLDPVSMAVPLAVAQAYAGRCLLDEDAAAGAALLSRAAEGFDRLGAPHWAEATRAQERKAAGSRP